MVSWFGIQQLLNDFYVSHRLLQRLFFLMFFHSTFDVGRSMFDVHAQFLFRSTWPRLRQQLG